MGSLTTPGSYTISRVLKPGKVLHSRMQFVPGKGFTLENKKFFLNLSLLVSSLREPLDLKAACGGSQYTELFKVILPSGNRQEEAEEEEEGEESYKEFSSTILRQVKDEYIAPALSPASAAAGKVRHGKE